MDPALFEFMSGHQIPVTETSLHNVEMIIQADLVEQEIVQGVAQTVVVSGPQQNFNRDEWRMPGSDDGSIGSEDSVEFVEDL